MKQEKIIELTKKLGLNEKAMQNLIKQDIKKAEKIVSDAAKFMGVN